VSWIKCSDRIPDLYKRVLVNIKDVGIAIAHYTEDMCVCDFLITSVDQHTLGLKKITHWMPLPEPPEE
jgi:hypothetical protein